jgi:hypothetical protein
MSATISSPAAQRWLPRLWSGHPHQVIRTSAGHPYLLRWFLVPPNRYCQVYWHRFIGSDEPTPHDHPWHFFSIVLRGRYFEESVSRPGRWRTPGHVAFRRATHTHRVVLATDESERERPCTTVVITGLWLRLWGFWCDREHFIPWQDFGAGGCGELR